MVDVASTSNSDIQSTFTNYGAPPVWMAAPGEGVVTTYPWGTYAAGWGTSFSTPFVAGTAAVMLGAMAAVAVRTFNWASPRLTISATSIWGSGAWIPISPFWRAVSCTDRRYGRVHKPRIRSARTSPPH